MRIYRDCLEAITDIGRELKKCATTVHTQTMQNKDIRDNPDYETKEIQAFSFTILDTTDKSMMPNATSAWCLNEFQERIDPDTRHNPGIAWLMRKEVWKEFLVKQIDGKDKFDYTYSERMGWQVQANIAELNRNPDTRQAIIQVHNRLQDQDKMGKQRVPCSMFYQFMLRDGKLDVIYVMRSTDFVTHFQNDVWLAAELRDHIARELGKPPGKFIMFASSLHVYRKDWKELSNY